jgi:hypothetical protein
MVEEPFHPETLGKGESYEPSGAVGIKTSSSGKEAKSLILKV